MLETIKTFLLAQMGLLAGAVLRILITFVVRLVVSLVLLIIQTFFKQGIAETNFVDFDKLIDMFNRIINLANVRSAVYAISFFIIAFGIIVSGIKMASGYLDKTGDSPSAFLKRILYTLILLLGYKTICKYVIQIMNAIATSKPFNMMDNLTIFDSVGSFIDSLFDISEASFDLASGIVSIVLYGILISKIIPAIITYYERYLSFSLYLLMGPVVISLGVDPENKDIGKNWLMGILSQMMVILFSMFVFNLFLLQLKAFMFGDTIGSAISSVEDLNKLMLGQTVTADRGLSLTSVSNLIVCCALLTIVEKSEQFINMLGLRTIPSGDTARAFSGKIASTFHNGLHMIGGATNKVLDMAQGKGRKDGYQGIQKMAKSLGYENAHIVDHHKNIENIANARVKGEMNKQGGPLTRMQKNRIKKDLIDHGASAAEANAAVNNAADKYAKKAVRDNKILGEAQKTGKDVDSKLIEDKIGTNNGKIKLKSGEARMAYNMKTGSDVLGKTADGQEIYGRWVTDSQGNTKLAFFKGHKDADGNIIGKSFDPDGEDLKMLHGIEMGVKNEAGEFDIHNSQIPPKFQNDEQFKNLLNDARVTDAAVNTGFATNEDLEKSMGKLNKYIEDHGGLEDDESLISVGKFDMNNVTMSDTNFAAAYCDFGAQVREIDPETHNGANIATSEFKYNEETGKMHVETNTYKGDIRRDLVEDKDGNLTVRETNHLEQVTSGAAYDTSNSIFEQGAASNFASSQFGGTLEKLYNASEEDVVKTDDGMRYKTKEEKRAEQRAEREEEHKALCEIEERIKTEGHEARNANDLYTFGEFLVTLDDYGKKHRLSAEKKQHIIEGYLASKNIDLGIAEAENRKLELLMEESRNEYYKNKNRNNNNKNNSKGKKG